MYNLSFEMLEGAQMLNCYVFKPQLTSYLIHHNGTMVLQQWWPGGGATFSFYKKKFD